MNAPTENLMLTQALALAARGRHVFPIKAGCKSPPLIKDFPNKATRDTQQITAWWTQWPYANIGISTSKFGDGSEALLVIDVDVRDSKGGAASWERLREEHSLPETYAQATPSGGWHAVYRVAEGVKSTTGKLGSGIDVKSRAGYILAAGSVFEGKAYSVAEDKEVAFAPHSLIDKCGRVPEKRDNTPKVQAYQPRALTKAVQIIADAYAVAEGSRNDALNMLGYRVRLAGLHQVGAAPLLVAKGVEWGLGKDECERTVRSVYESDAIPEGADAVDVQFTRVEVEPGGIAAPEEEFTRTNWTDVGN